MISFVDISNGKFYDYENWDFICENGGLKVLLPTNDYVNIFNEGAAKETRKKIMSDAYLGKMEMNDALNILEPFEIAIKFFDERNKLINNI